LYVLIVSLFNKDEAAAGSKTSGSEINLKSDEFAYLNDFSIPNDQTYLLLGFKSNDEGILADIERIKQKYKIVSLVCHPDKSTPEDRDKAEERFKSLLLGYEKLCDPQLRRVYDSSLPFDDSIPSDKKGLSEKTFFSIYGPVFMSNSRYSVIRPVPQLGDLSTSDDDINRFYDFWFSFKSWRDFSYLSKHKPETASSREEKRWMIRENAKEQSEAKKHEIQRVRKLVEDAFKKDPRVKRMKGEALAAKNRKNAEKIKAQQEKEAKLKQQQEEELRRKQEEENKIKEAKGAKQRQQKFIKETRAKFGKACKANDFPQDETDHLRATATMDQLSEITDALNAGQIEEGKSLFEHAIGRPIAPVETQEEKTNTATDSSSVQHKSSSSTGEADSRWDHAAESQLIQAIKKTPGRHPWESSISFLQS